MLQKLRSLGYRFSNTDLAIIIRPFHWVWPDYTVGRTKSDSESDNWAVWVFVELGPFILRAEFSDFGPKSAEGWRD